MIVVVVVVVVVFVVVENVLVDRAGKRLNWLAVLNTGFLKMAAFSKGLSS